jgi:hypothetical protein
MLMSAFLVISMIGISNALCRKLAQNGYRRVQNGALEPSASHLAANDPTNTVAVAESGCYLFVCDLPRGEPSAPV